VADVEWKPHYFILGERRLVYYKDQHVCWRSDMYLYSCFSDMLDLIWISLRFLLDMISLSIVSLIARCDCS
jgi:hypothetical protein